MKLYQSALMLLVTASLALGQVPEDQKQKIAEASPTEPIVKVDTKRKLLVFSRTTGFRHKSIPWGIEALRVMGEKTGAYTMDATEDPAAFTDENLKQYDAVVMLNTTGDPIPDASQQKALEQFVAGGKGLIGIHAASDTGYKWEAYGKMIGGYFNGHPWHAGSVVTIANEHTSDPINYAAYGDQKTFQHRDEIYQYKDEPYSRDCLHILQSLDLTGPNMDRKGMKRADNDYPVAWIQQWQAGRVYYSNLGHNEATYWSTPVLKHFLAGIQYACGDLKCDATPSNKLDKK
ncbi:ThuA domain-containing protein [Planctomycetales bacterium ZRK34]|nr:ThuA domain-containing protein [Planctomycetales bacterium ZRK34]